MKTPSTLRSKADQSTLVCVDVQTRLATAMPNADMTALIRNASTLLQAAPMLEIPVILTEQYPQGLGETLPELKALAPHAPVVAKTHFSCMADPAFTRLLTTDRPQVVLFGIEAHICMLQTALAMIDAGKQVFILEDAILSRKAHHKNNAIQRLQSAGAIMSNTESFLFECLGKAEGDVFKAISKLVR